MEKVLDTELTDSLNDEGVADQAFIVRGHHTTRIFNILAMGMTVEDVLEMTVSHSGKEGSPYYKDVYGSGAADFDRTAFAFKGFFRDFLELPDDARVRIASGERDGICNSCVVGAHCTLVPAAEVPFVRAVGKMARELGAEDDIVESEVTITSKRGRKKRAPAIEISAGTARAILSDVNFHAETLPRVIRAGATRRVKKSIAKRQAQA